MDRDPGGIFGPPAAAKTTLPPEVGGTAPKLVTHIPPHLAWGMSSHLLEKGNQVEGKSLSLLLWNDVGNTHNIDGISSTSFTPIREWKADGKHAGKDYPHSSKCSRIQPMPQNTFLLWNRWALAHIVYSAQRALPSLPNHTDGTQILDVGTNHAAASWDTAPTHPEESSDLITMIMWMRWWWWGPKFLFVLCNSSLIPGLCM